MDMNIKGVDEGLVLKCKGAALSAGQSLKAWVVKRLEEAVNEDGVGVGVQMRGDAEGKERPGRKVHLGKRSEGVPEAHEPTGSQVESSAVGDGLRKDRSGEGKGKEAGVKRMSVEEFFKLSNSDQDRARRTGRF